MIRGDVVAVDLEPARVGEASKVRPCIVISNAGANAVATRLGRGVVTVVPLTTNVDRVFAAFEVLIEDAGVLESMGLSARSKAQAAQLRAVSVHRVGAVVGRCPRGVLAAVDDAVRFQLSL